MEYDEDKAEEMVLAPLLLTTFEETPLERGLGKGTTGTYSIGSMQRVTFQTQEARPNQSWSPRKA
jgi:hypothetical protein